jgi:hypothetical protein
MKSSGDWLKGGKEMESPRNPPRNKGGTSNRLGVALGHRWEEIGRRRSPNAGWKIVKGYKYPGAGLLRLELAFQTLSCLQKFLLDKTWSIDHNLAHVDH